MAKLECGCEFSDYRPGGEFLLYAGSTLLGRSELEWEDSADGVWLRSGSFFPTENYLRIDSIFRRHSRAVLATRQLSSAAANAELLKSKEEIDRLRLRLVHSSGREIPGVTIEVQDFADSLTDDPRELQVEIRDRSVHANFFSQTVV